MAIERNAERNAERNLEKTAKRVTPWIKWVVIGIVAAIVLSWLWPVYQVPTGHRGVVTVGGKITGVEGEGFTLVWPWQKLSIFNVRSETVQIQGAEGATADTQPVNVSLTVRYSVLPDKVILVFEQFSRDGNLDSFMSTAAHDSFKAATSKFTATDLIAKRPAVVSDIITTLREKVAKYGAQVINVDITDFKFSPDYMKAINEKTTQEQLRLAAENKVRTVEAEQKQKVAVAEAEATALRAQADGEAYAKLKAAEAEAKSLQIQNEALSKNKDVLELRKLEVEKIKAEKWDGQLPQNIYAGAPIPFLNLSNK